MKYYFFVIGVHLDLFSMQTTVDDNLNGKTRKEISSRQLSLNFIDFFSFCFQQFFHFYFQTVGIINEQNFFVLTVRQHMYLV